MASRSLNRVTLIGNLTRDPELKYTPAGVPVCTFGVATNRSWTTSSGEQKEESQFHRIVAWQKLAELCSKLLIKGKKIYLEGRLTYRNYTTKDGTQKQLAEIVLEDFIVLSENRRNVTDSDEAEKSKPQSVIDEENKETSDTVEDELIPPPDAEMSETQQEDDSDQANYDEKKDDTIPF